jgi:hypothetical protein
MDQQPHTFLQLNQLPPHQKIMKHFSALMAFGALFATPVMAQTDCATAITISAGIHMVPGITGTEVPLPVCAQNGMGANGGEWYRYIPAMDHTVTVTTDLPSNTGLDPRVHIYTGTCGSLECVAGDDDSGSGFLAVVTFNVSGGNLYYIAFDDRWSTEGFEFQLTESTLVPEMVSFVNQSISVGGSTLAVVDMNGDHLDDIVGITGTNINIHHQQAAGGFVPSNYPNPQVANTPSWSLAAGDITGNGFLDLLYGGGSGVTFMMANDDGTSFTEVTGPQYVFSQRSNFIDINNDGHLDAFVCHDVQPNVYYINDGDGNLTFFQGGLGDTPDGGNYGSIWIDYDNDGDMDLFLAKCRGGTSLANINQLHRNNGDGTFTEMGAVAGLADNIQTWSAAWGDFDNDGFMDVMVGASNTTNGSHKLMRNNGDGTFTDITAGSGYDIFPSVNIEHVTHDFNNDGYLDILGGGNTIMMNNGDMTFTPIPVGFGVGPIGDINNDGFLDVVNGGTIRVNQGNSNNWIKINTIGVISNRNGIGARVQVTSTLGTQIRDVRSGDGFRYMSSMTAHFGLGQDAEIEEVVIYWPSGLVDVVTGPAVNSTLNIVEGLTTSVEEVIEEGSVSLFPIPASDRLFVSGPGLDGNVPLRIYDASGRMVMEKVLRSGTLDVSDLQNGAYLLHLVVADGDIVRRFIKQ